MTKEKAEDIKENRDYDHHHNGAVFIIGLVILLIGILGLLSTMGVMHCAWFSRGYLVRCRK
jgi:hypothetical protein